MPRRCWRVRLHAKFHVPRVVTWSSSLQQGNMETYLRICIPINHIEECLLAQVEKNCNILQTSPQKHIQDTCAVIPMCEAMRSQWLFAKKWQLNSCWPENIYMSKSIPWLVQVRVLSLSWEWFPSWVRRQPLSRTCHNQIVHRQTLQKLCIIVIETNGSTEKMRPRRTPRILFWTSLFSSSHPLNIGKKLRNSNHHCSKKIYLSDPLCLDLSNCSIQHEIACHVSWCLDMPSSNTVQL